MTQFSDRQMAWIRRWRHKVHDDCMTIMEFERHIGEELKLTNARISKEEIVSVALDLLESMSC